MHNFEISTLPRGLMFGSYALPRSARSLGGRRSRRKLRVPLPRYAHHALSGRRQLRVKALSAVAHDKVARVRLPCVLQLPILVNRLRGALPT